jgi:hypothetical protein
LLGQFPTALCVPPSAILVLAVRVVAPLAFSFASCVVRDSLIFLSVAEFLSLSILLNATFCIQHLLNASTKWVGHSLTTEFSVIACLVNLSIFFLNPLRLFRYVTKVVSICS